VTKGSKLDEKQGLMTAEIRK